MNFWNVAQIESLKQACATLGTGPEELNLDIFFPDALD